MNILLIMLAGFVATLAMTLVMGFIHGLGLANADMVRAIGSLFTRKYENAFWPGALAHFGAGTIFALLYAALGGLAPLPVSSGVATVIMMTIFGAFHGFAVSIILAITVAEYHPLEQFRKAGGDVVVSHFVGHLVYGFFVGLILAMTGVDLKLISL